MVRHNPAYSTPQAPFGYFTRKTNDPFHCSESNRYTFLLREQEQTRSVPRFGIKPLQPLFFGIKRNSYNWLEDEEQDGETFSKSRYTNQSSQLCKKGFLTSKNSQVAMTIKEIEAQNCSKILKMFSKRSSIFHNFFPIFSKFFRALNRDEEEYSRWLSRGSFKLAEIK